MIVPLKVLRGGLDAKGLDSGHLGVGVEVLPSQDIKCSFQKDHTTTDKKGQVVIYNQQ